MHWFPSFFWNYRLPRVSPTLRLVDSLSNYPQTLKVCFTGYLSNHFMNHLVADLSSGCKFVFTHAYTQTREKKPPQRYINAFIYSLFILSF